MLVPCHPDDRSAICYDIGTHCLSLKQPRADAHAGSWIPERLECRCLSAGQASPAAPLPPTRWIFDGTRGDDTLIVLCRSCTAVHIQIIGIAPTPRRYGARAHSSSCPQASIISVSLHSLRQALAQHLHSQGRRACRGALYGDPGRPRWPPAGTGERSGSQASQHITAGLRLFSAAAQAPAQAPARHAAAYGAPLGACARANWAAVQRRCQATLPEAASISETIGVELSRFLPLSQSQQWTATHYRKIVAEMQVIVLTTSCRRVMTLPNTDRQQVAARLLPGVIRLRYGVTALPGAEASRCSCEEPLPAVPTECSHTKT